MMMEGYFQVFGVVVSFYFAPTPFIFLTIVIKIIIIKKRRIPKSNEKHTSILITTCSRKISNKSIQME